MEKLDDSTIWEHWILSLFPLLFLFSHQILDPNTAIKFSYVVCSMHVRSILRASAFRGSVYMSTCSVLIEPVVVPVLTTA